MAKKRRTCRRTGGGRKTGKRGGEGGGVSRRRKRVGGMLGTPIPKPMLLDEKFDTTQIRSGYAGPYTIKVIGSITNYMKQREFYFKTFKNSRDVVFFYFAYNRYSNNRFKSNEFWSGFNIWHLSIPQHPSSPIEFYSRNVPCTNVDKYQKGMHVKVEGLINGWQSGVIVDKEPRWLEVRPTLDRSNRRKLEFDDDMQHKMFNLTLFELYNTHIFTKMIESDPKYIKYFQATKHHLSYLNNVSNSSYNDVYYQQCVELFNNYKRLHRRDWDSQP